MPLPRFALPMDFPISPVLYDPLVTTAAYLIIGNDVDRHEFRSVMDDLLYVLEWTSLMVKLRLLEITPCTVDYTQQQYRRLGAGKGVLVH